MHKEAKHSSKAWKLCGWSKKFFVYSEDYIYTSIGGNQGREDSFVSLHPFRPAVTKGHEILSISTEDKVQWL